VQRWSLQQKDYSPGSGPGDAASEARLRDGKDNTPHTNIGVLYEGGQKIEDRESGGDATLHSEPLLIGGRILNLGLGTSAELSDTTTRSATFGRYKTAGGRGQAELYTERAPCPSCRSILDVALRADDIVSYTVAYADSATMTANLSQLLAHARSYRNDENVASEMEQEEEDRALETAADRRRPEQSLSQGRFQGYPGDIGGGFEVAGLEAHNRMANRKSPACTL
jgi:hypothetical protein